MPAKYEKIPIGNKALDKRTKLTPEKRARIIELDGQGKSSREIAQEVGVSKTTVLYVLRPALYKEMLKTARERKKANNNYYNKDKNAEYQRSHRKHKKKLYQQGLLK